MNQCGKCLLGTLFTLTLMVFFVEHYLTNGFLKAVMDRSVLDSRDHGRADVKRIAIKSCPLVEDLTPRYICSSNISDSGPVSLTLFTTMTYRTQKLPAYKRTIDLWPSLGPKVKPLLYLAPKNDSHSTDYSGNLELLAERACARGWDVLIAPRCNAYNYPMLNSMFKLTQQFFNSTWYGFSNADILFTNYVDSNLRFLHALNATEVDFVIGKRTNIVVPDKKTVLTAADVATLVRNKRQHRSDAEDYFICRRNRFPWHKVPPFVVGRPGFDNWLVWYTYKNRIPAVDVSRTNPVLHQSLQGVRSDHGSIKVSDRRYNQKMYGKVNFRLGHTSCTRYVTSYEKKGNSTSKSLVLLERKWKGEKPCKGQASIQRVS